MIGHSDIASIVEEYDRLKLRIGMTASHSALDICDGAIEEGFPTVAYCKEGRHKTYANYFKTHRSSSGRVFRGMVDKAIVLNEFNDVLDPEMQAEMRKRNVIYIPNRSFTSYSAISDIEENFRVPMFGSRNMLRMEERTEDQDYYWILEKAGLPYPEKIDSPEEIDCLVIVKLHLLFDLEDYATTYRATRDAYLKAANELKLATGPYKAARDAYVAATATYTKSLYE